MDVRELGRYIRQQREGSRLSLRGLSGLTGVSGTYLSQVERGLRKPSADILQGIAKGLRISAETLYVQAGILEDRPVADVASVIMSDLAVTERQKQALVQIYEAFREETARNLAAAALEAHPEATKTPTKTATKTATKTPTKTATKTATKTVTKKKPSSSATSSPAASNGSRTSPRVRARTIKEA